MMISDRPDGLYTFTPNVPGKSYRAFMLVDEGDMVRIDEAKRLDKNGWELAIIDQHGRGRYLVKGAPCGAGCHCAAEIVVEMDKKETAPN